jgi:hypothetical protein
MATVRFGSEAVVSPLISDLGSWGAAFGQKESFLANENDHVRGRYY